MFAADACGAAHTSSRFVFYVFFCSQPMRGGPLPPAREHDLGPKCPSNMHLFMICFQTSSPPAKKVRTRWVHTLTLALLTDSVFCCADAWGATPTSGMTARGRFLQFARLPPHTTWRPPRARFRCSPPTDSSRFFVRSCCMGGRSHQLALFFGQAYAAT